MVTYHGDGRRAAQLLDIAADQQLHAASRHREDRLTRRINHAVNGVEVRKHVAAGGLKGRADRYDLLLAVGVREGVWCAVFLGVAQEFIQPERGVRIALADSCDQFLELGGEAGLHGSTTVVIADEVTQLDCIFRCTSLLCQPLSHHLGRHTRSGGLH